MSARRLLVKGRVQGVFYRGWTERNARALGISGWVRNLADGDVEAVIAGPEAALDEMIRRAWEGPPAARVDDIEVSEVEEVPTGPFEQRRTQ